MSDEAFLLIAGAAVVIGATVQASLGLGLGLVAAPVVALLDPSLMPGAVLVTTAALPALTLISEWRHIDVRGMLWALGGRLIGTVGGVWVVAVLAPRTLSAAVGVMVLVTVGLTVRTVRISPAPATLSIAGAISGVSGTATSIGGPPIAIVYQHEPGPRVRSTLSGYLVVGVIVSLAALALGGQLHQREVVAGAALLPFVLVGFILSRHVRRLIAGPRLRNALLLLVTISGVVLIGQSFG